MSSDRQRAIEFWWKRSRESLLSAQRDFEAGAYSLAVSRLYYASFHAVSALLLKDNLAFRRHSGVRAAFHQNFVKTPEK